MEDAPKSLASVSARNARHSRLHLPHVAPLRNFVHVIRRERECGDHVPYFDPEDGGIEAECLFLLQAPGPKAVKSGFVSRNNPDESARNWHEANQEAGLARTRTATWNIIPWYIGDETRIRAPRPSDVADGWPYLVALLKRLRQLRLVVLVGRHAQAIHPQLAALRLPLVVMHTPHPSPQFVNRRPENRAVLHAAVREVATMLRRMRAR